MGGGCGGGGGSYMGGEGIKSWPLDQVVSTAWIHSLMGTTSFGVVLGRSGLGQKRVREEWSGPFDQNKSPVQIERDRNDAV